MKKHLIKVAALLIPVIIAGCIASGTVVIIFDLVGFQSTNTNMPSQHVDLSTNKDYNDNKDKLKSVDAISLVGYVGNLGSADVNAEVWISDSSYTTPDEVRANATRIFVSPTIPANDTIFIDWSDGMGHIENFSVLQDQIKGDGVFYLYGLAEGPFAIDYAIELVITITAGL